MSHANRPLRRTTPFACATASWRRCTPTRHAASIHDYVTRLPLLPVRKAGAVRANNNGRNRPRRHLTCETCRKQHAPMRCWGGVGRRCGKGKKGTQMHINTTHVVAHRPIATHRIRHSKLPQHNKPTAKLRQLLSHPNNHSPIDVAWVPQRGRGHAPAVPPRCMCNQGRGT